MEKQPGRKLQLLALGDSYTIGEQVREEENFPHQLVGKLSKKGILFDNPRIIAKTGWTTDELQLAIDAATLVGPFDFVTLLVGVNNQYRGRAVDEYIPEFDALLRQAIGFAGNNVHRVAVLSIPDWSVTPFAGLPKDDGAMHDRQEAAEAIDRYNEANEAIAGKYGVHYISITEGTREAKNNGLLLAPDLLHPSGLEYARWADRLADIVAREIKAN